MFSRKTLKVQLKIHWKNNVTLISWPKNKTKKNFFFFMQRPTFCRGSSGVSYNDWATARIEQVFVFRRSQMYALTLQKTKNKAKKKIPVTLYFSCFCFLLFKPLQPRHVCAPYTNAAFCRTLVLFWRARCRLKAAVDLSSFSKAASIRAERCCDPSYFCPVEFLFKIRYKIYDIVLFLCWPFTVNKKDARGYSVARILQLANDAQGLLYSVMRACAKKNKKKNAAFAGQLYYAGAAVMSYSTVGSAHSIVEGF